MTVRLRHEGDSAEVALAGELCLDTVEELATVLAGLCTDESGTRRIVIDVHDLTLISGAGINLVQHHRRHWCRDGRTIEVVRARGVVRRVLQIVGVPVATP